MALGLLTKLLSLGQDASANTFVDLVSFVGPASYTSPGGDTGLEALLQVQTRDSRDVLAFIDQSLGTHYAAYDRANEKFKTYVRATGVETDNAVDLSGVTFKGLLVSR